MNFSTPLRFLSMFLVILSFETFATNYDYSLGVPGSKGASYVTANANTIKIFEDPISHMGLTITNQGYSKAGPRIYTAPEEVKKTWSEGWTGKNINVLHLGSSADNTLSFNVTPILLIDLFAPGANKYALDTNTTNNQNSVKDINGNDINSTVTMKVINADFHDAFFNYLLGVPKQNDIKNSKDVLNGTVKIKNLDIPDSVIVKPAGYTNDNGSYTDHYNFEYINDNNINSRLIIVDGIPYDYDKPTKQPVDDSETKSEENTPNNEALTNKLLLADGQDPYSLEGITITDMSRVSNNKKEGSWFLNSSSSNAAAKVSAYAAILRHKFPNLNAEQTASILLDTAQTNSLACHPNCPSNIYGRGVADIRKAISPVGNLK